MSSSTSPLRVAIVGAGPSGFFAADHLLKTDPNVRIDLFDRLCTPFGLVRLGVSPDHHKIKSITRTFEKVFNDNPERARFFGNVTVGKDISVDELRAHHHAVMFTHGAESDRKLGVPGEDLKGSHTATEFVAWYNGHPDARDLTFDLDQEVAFIIGQGNVAMDVARILAKSADELATTDIAAHALEALSKSKVKEIHIIGRRGPAQVKFTVPEVREMGELEFADVVVDKQDLVLNEASALERDEGPEATRKILAILEQYSTSERRPSSTKRIYFRFLLSPKELHGDTALREVTLERNKLSGSANEQSARGSGDVTKEACGLVFRSVGYRGTALPGLPFDEKSGTVPNEGGRVTEGGSVVNGLYTAGWIKRGPSGVIGTNKPDAQESANAILADRDTLSTTNDDPSAVSSLLASRGVRVVSWADWKKIDAKEVEAGVSTGKPREKFTRITDVMSALGD